MAIEANASASSSAFNNKSHITPFARMLFIVGFVVVSMLIALAASADFLNNFKNFVLLLAVFVPWSAVNLVDYYLVSRERVDIPALYDSNARYGAYNAVALGCYVLGIVVQIPFLAQKMYTGPLTKMLGGADISWIVSLVVTALVYYPLAKRTMKVPSQMIFPASERPAMTGSHGSGLVGNVRTGRAG